MSSEPTNILDAEPADSGLEPGVRYYLFLGCAGLLVMWLLLTEKFGLFALVPTLLGALGMAGYLAPTNWGGLSSYLRRPKTMLPILVIVSILIFEILLPDFLRSDFQISDLLISLAILVYLAAQYRLFSLGSAAVPPDARPRPDRLAGDEPDPRPARLVAPRELAWLGGILLGCAIAGQLLWRFLITEWVVVDVDEPARLGLTRLPWRFLMLIWLLGVGALVLGGLFRILRDYRMSGDEARMVLQDELWAETRGEQRRSARWLAWARRKAERQLEKPR